MQNEEANNDQGFDVIICGLGPTGGTLANLLALNNHSVLVIERDEDIYYAPRAVHFDDEAMRVFQAAGIAKEMLETSEPFILGEFISNKYARISVHIGSQDKCYGYDGAFWFHQPILEKVIRNGLKRFDNVKVVLGAEVIAIEQNDNSVSVSAQYTDGKRFTAHAQYLIGCDGGKSFVRKTAGISLDSADFDEAWVVVDTKTKSEKKHTDLPENHRQYLNPKQPVTYVPMAFNYYEWQFMVMGNKTEQQATEPFLVREQLKPFVDLNTVEITRIAYYKFHGLWGNKWYNNRIVMAGDSIHQMPPFLGQGMCSGIRDASALAWRLDLILKNKADAKTLLESYQEERLEHVKHIINGAMFLGNLIQVKKKWQAILRDVFLLMPAKMFPQIKDFVYKTANRKRPLETGIIGTNRKKIAGSLLIQPVVTNQDGTEILLHEELGYGFSVLAKRNIVEKHKQQFKALENLGCRFVEFDKTASGLAVADKSGILQKFFNEHNLDFAIIRPDQYIFDGGKENDITATVQVLNKHFTNTQSQAL